MTDVRREAVANCSHGEIESYPGKGARCRKCGAWATFDAARVAAALTPAMYEHPRGSGNWQPVPTTPSPSEPSPAEGLRELREAYNAIPAGQPSDAEVLARLPALYEAIEAVLRETHDAE